MAIVGAGSMARVVAELLVGHGWSPVLHDRLEELVDGGLGEGDVVVFTELTALAGARELKALGPSGSRPTAVVVCDSLLPGEVRVALAGGVAGIVTEARLAESLAPTMAAALAGQIAVPRLQARQVEAASLSTREKEILGLVVMGCSNCEIADRLVVAESTVKSHLSSAFGKLGVRSRNEAIDLILDAERGLGMGILGLEGERIEIGAPN